MSAWCLLPVLLLLHQVAGHSLPVPQEHDGGGQNGGGLDGGGLDECGQDGGGLDGNGQDRDTHSNHVARTRITQVNKLTTNKIK